MRTVTMLAASATAPVRPMISGDSRNARRASGTRLSNAATSNLSIAASRKSSLAIRPCRRAGSYASMKSPPPTAP